MAGGVAGGVAGGGLAACVLPAGGGRWAVVLVEAGAVGGGAKDGRAPPPPPSPACQAKSLQRTSQGRDIPFVHSLYALNFTKLLSFAFNQSSNFLNFSEHSVK